MGCGASTPAPPAAVEAPPPVSTVTTGTPESAAIVIDKPATHAAAAASVDPRVADAFKLIDKNSDGTLSKAEVLLALRKHESVRELLGLTTGKEADGSREAFDAAFALMDKDESATISPAELTAYLKDALNPPPPAAPPAPPPLELALQASIKVWGRKVFEQFDTDKNGQLDKTELTRALKALPKAKPTTAPPGAKYMSVEEMIGAMDSDTDGGVDVGEWLANLEKCAGLAAALAEAVNDAGVVEKFRSFEQQKAKRESEIAELEGKMMTASIEETTKLAEEMEEYERQVASLAKKIEEANANYTTRMVKELEGC